MKNKTNLTPEEHYLAHQLLIFIYPGESRLAFAAFQMTFSSKFCHRKGNKLYGWLRRRCRDATSKALKGKKKSPEHCENIRIAKLGKKASPEAKVSMKLAANRIEVGAKKSLALRGKKKSLEHRATMSRLRKGKKQSLEHIAKRAAGVRAFHARRRLQGGVA